MSQIAYFVHQQNGGCGWECVIGGAQIMEVMVIVGHEEQSEMDFSWGWGGSGACREQG